MSSPMMQALFGCLTERRHAWRRAAISRCSPRRSGACSPTPAGSPSPHLQRKFGATLLQPHTAQGPQCL